MRRAALLLLLAAAAPAAEARHPLRDRADLSFSAIPLGTTRPPAALGLRERHRSGCHAFGECDWADAAGVLHYFREGDELVVKSVAVREWEGRPIAALGIGRARVRDAVIERVRAFLPEVALDCDPELCAGTLDEGWVRLFFDSQGNLSEVRIDARHFS